MYLDTNFVVNIGVLPPLPSKAGAQLRKRLSKYESYYDEDLSKVHLSQVDKAFPVFLDNQGFISCSASKPLDAYDIRDAFFEFVLSFMKDY